MSGVDGAEDLLQVFITNVKDPEKVKVVDELVGKWSEIAKGQTSPSFNYKDINGELVALEDLKGKYVYIDCWASWCGPCKAEIPHLKKLKKKFDGKNIAFVGISSDQDVEAWKKMVDKQKLEGIQLHIGDDQSFMQAYMVTGIPRFILIDKDGLVYDANAPRPSSDEIKELFNSLEGI